MEPDLDDTVRAAPRPPERVPGEDHDDTIVRRVGTAPADPPALVEPPEPEPRPLPVVEPVVIEPDYIEPDDVEPDDVEPDAGFRVRFPDGTAVTLDVPVYVGRKPSIPRIHTGPKPRLVTVPSPGKELSATHLELKVVGGTVVASDMRSTNGTVVRLPGAAARTLIRGETAVVVPGTRIDLGEGAVLDILAPPEAGP